MWRRIATDSDEASGAEADSNGADSNGADSNGADGNEVNGDLAKNVTAIWIDKDINIKQGMDE